MHTCIIHIGMHKTGSTSIQHSLQGFADQHITYADLGDSPNHSYAIYDLFTQGAERGFFDVQPDVSTIDAYEKLLLQAIADTGTRDLLISGEQISSMPPAALTRLRDFLAPHFQNIRVVSYVRPPASYLASAFQQRLKKRSPNFEPMRLYRSFKDTFQKFDDIFGRTNVELWKFDSTTLHNRCAVSDFCQRLGLEFPAERIRTENESMSRQFVGLLYVYRKFAPELAASLQIAEVEGLNRKLSGIWSDKFALSHELTQAIHQQHAADIAWMEQRLGQSLEETLRKEPKHAISREEDLIQTPSETIEGLYSALGKPHPQTTCQIHPVDVAELFHELRTKPPGLQPSSWWASYRARLNSTTQRLRRLGRTS
ncbi:hypothetical protein HNE05_17285 [Aquipseudomonas campi]|uniref:Sulfotransferase family protein n=1 Tax=Aquipseudomonas campi TaxID=2731681 RepID=A0A6M8FL11_9GAMM|nr:hypothetical protein [Pseudomonas campi]QKE65032.1 hypothetical protein HNE05_17285 [Pseudomonas campi]